MQVACERCATNYSYVLERSGKGSCRARIGLWDGESAKKKAIKAAEYDVARKLERGVGIVPCPKCYWMNEEAFQLFRKPMYPNILNFIAISFLFGVLGIVGAAILRDLLGNDSIIAFGLLLASFATGGSAPLLLPFSCWQLRRQSNPNASFPHLSKLPSETPSAIVEHVGAETRERILAPVAPNERVEPKDAEPWAVFRIGEFLLPEYCCVCMAPAAISYRSSFRLSVRDKDLEAPLCIACWRHRSRLRWLLSIVLTLISFGFVAFVVHSTMPADDRNILPHIWTFGVMTSIALSTIIPGWLCRPYRFHYLHRDRGIIRFAAHNPLYTRLLIDLHRRSQRFAIKNLSNSDSFEITSRITDQ